MLSVRKAKKEDVSFLFKLHNEESVRMASWNTSPVDWQTHVQWLESSLLNPDRVLYVIESDGVPAGQVRFDVVDDGVVAEVGISISENFRGRGLGKDGLIRAGEVFLAEFPSVKSIKAYIKPENSISVRLFERADYRHIDEVKYKGRPCISMQYNR